VVEAVADVSTNVSEPKAKRVLVHSYEPRGGCKDVFESREEEILVSGPAGTGKSRACLEKIYTVCLLTPNVRALILRKTLRSLGSSALVTWRNYVAKEAIATGQVVYYGGSSQEAPQYRFKNGSSVTIGGLDNAMRIMSTEYDIVYVQEATEITLEDLEHIKTRLRNWVISFQQLIMDCNPAGDKHWLKLRCDDGKCILVESRHEDNPRLFNLDGTMTEYGEKYMAILDGLTGVRLKRLRYGLWVSAEGIVYEEFDPAVHVLPWDFDDEGNRLELPWEWERYWVIDFGYVHPFVLKCYAIGDEGEVYCYREIHMSHRTVAEHAAQIMSIVTRRETVEWYDHFNRVMRSKEEIVWNEPEPTAIICDHDAEDRATFERETGLGTVAAIKHVSVGIDLQKDRFKIDPRTGLSGFYYMADALVEADAWLRERLLPTDSVQQYASYVWKLSADGRIMDVPVKKDDDGPDTDRYLTTYLDWKGSPRVTVMEF